ncbi:MAG: DUF4340 domain-containing protein [Desulfobulbus sp.]|nr:DUF4340 domain-containing protein [Desulfobulbus sp.]
MRQLIIIGTLLLLVQTGLTVATHTLRNTGTLQPAGGPLLELKAADVTEMILEDQNGNRLSVKKQNSAWLLPQKDSFPADSGQVEKFLEQIVNLQRGWPEAATAEAAGRFRVAADQFERKLTLRRDDQVLGVVYFGSSAGLRKRYVRIDGDNEIQTLSVGPYELETAADNWIDRGILRLKSEEIVGVNLPGLRLERGPDGLKPSDLAGTEEIVKDRLDQLVRQLTGLTISGLLGTTEKPAYGLGKPVLSYSVELDNKTTIDYVVGREEKLSEPAGEDTLEPADETFVLKVSNQKHLFRVDAWQINEIRNVTRASLVHSGEHKPPAGDGKTEQVEQ